MAVKKMFGTTTLVFSAVQVAVKVLRNPDVQAQLRKAPTYVTGWAAERRAERDAAGREPLADRLNPLNRYGIAAMRRRVNNLQRTVNRLRGRGDDVVVADLDAALAELASALDFAAGLPRAKRREAQARVEMQLDALEAAFMAAVLPPGATTASYQRPAPPPQLGSGG
jgi:hypothetical protein